MRASPGWVAAERAARLATAEVPDFPRQLTTKLETTMQSSPLLETSPETDDFEDFEDIESLINPKPAPDANDFDDLEALLDEALADKKQAEQVKAARAKA